MFKRIWHGLFGHDSPVLFANWPLPVVYVCSGCGKSWEIDSDKDLIQMAMQTWWREDD